jgi:hypothetical protein
LQWLFDDVSVSGFNTFFGFGSVEFTNGRFEEVSYEVTTPGVCTPQFPCGIPDRGGRGYADPIAQTFFVDNQPFGCYITELDVFFRTKSLTSSITLEIREVVNGYPGDKVLPFGRVTLNPSAVNVDFNSASSATTFAFPSPVYLQNNTEYCFVLLPTGNDPNYTIWVSELGELDVTTNLRIAQQPNVGVLFTSSNNRTWTSYQSEDIKFNLKRAFFSTDVVAQLTLENDNFDYLRFDSIIGNNFVAGDKLHNFGISITNAGAGYTNGTVVGQLVGGGATTPAIVVLTISGGVVTNVAVSNPGKGYTSNPTGITFSSGTPSTAATFAINLNFGFIKEYDSLYNVAKVLINTGYFVENALVGNGSSFANISEIENKRYNTVKTNIGMITHNPCSVDWILGATQNGATTPRGGITGLDFDRNRNLPAEAAVFSYSNEQALTGTDKKSTKLTAIIKTNSNNVSPVIDLKKLALIAVANDINNDSSTETQNDGSASSRYISRRVNLDELQDSQDLKVYLTNTIPSGTDVEVYGKLLNSADSRNFEDLGWIKLNSLTVPTPEQRSVYSEYEYQLPAASYFTVATGDVNTSTEVITEVAHGLTTGDAVVYGNAGGTSITGLTDLTIYYVNAASDDTFILYNTATNAIAGGSTGKMNLTGTGNSSQYFVTSDGTYPDGEYRYIVDDLTLYSSYKTFAVKIVPLSDNTSIIPYVKELRAIALQV